MLVTYEGSTNCFKEASLAIRNQCSELEKLDNEKMKCKFQIQLITVIILNYINRN